MAVDFSGDRTKRGFAAPCRFEADLFDCEVEGELPQGLAGTFYRACYDRQYPAPLADDAIFNEDGAVDMFRFRDGRVDFRTRWVRTERLLAERRARRALFGRYRNRHTVSPEAAGLSLNVANTNVVYHGGKLLVLKESDRPIAIDPHTLETLGTWDYDGKLTSETFTAHPKIDARTGEMIAYGYEARGDASLDIAVFAIDRLGRITWELWLQPPLLSMLHDIAITPNYIILPTTSFTTSTERLHSGKVHWGFDPRQPTHLAVIPRGGRTEDVRWFDAPRHAMIHTINATEEDGRIVLDAPVSDSNPFPFFPAIDGSPWDPQGGKATVRRWTIDLASDGREVREEVLFPEQRGGGLARMDDRFTGQPFRYSYMGITDPGQPFDRERAGPPPPGLTNCYVRFDHVTGETESFFAGETRTLQEPCFVPRSAEAAEGDGWLIGVASNLADMHSELLVVDAQELGRGAVARVRLPFRLHSQVHGNWVPDDLLAA
jgi:carotenoid cleavage dioxygenase